MEQNGFSYVSRSEFWNWYLKQEDAKDMLSYNLSEERKKELFIKYMTVVNIETSAYCNRVCSYCPVGLHGSRPQKLIDEKLFKRMIDELSDLGYSRMFTFNLFNEPLLDSEYEKRIKYVRKKCPDSYICMNSNGDYMNREILDRLIDFGLNQALVTMHMGPTETYTDDYARERLEKFHKKLGLEFNITSETPGHNITCDNSYRGCRLLFVANNWAVDGCDRGGEMDGLSLEERLDPCATSFREIIIDVEGDVRCCWNAYVTSPAVLSMKDNSLVDAFFSKPLVDFRREHLLWNAKTGICKGCNTPDNSDRSTEEFRKTLLS